MTLPTSGLNGQRFHEAKQFIIVQQAFPSLLEPVVFDEDHPIIRDGYTPLEDGVKP